MKKYIIFSILLVLFIKSFCQNNSSLSGIIKGYPNGLPLEGVSVFSHNYGSKITNTQGIFSFNFYNKKQGDKVFIVPRKSGYKVSSLNIPIKFVIPSDPNELVIIEMCKIGNCPEDKLYDKIYSSINNRIDTLNYHISKLPENSKRIKLLNDSVTKLKKNLNDKEKIIKNLSKSFITLSSINRDKRKQVYDYLVQGNFDKAISIFEKENIRQKLMQIELEEKNKKRELEKINALKEDYLDANITLARIYVLNNNWSEAEDVYDNVIRNDSKIFDYVIEYSDFLRERKKYKKSKQYFELAQRLLPYKSPSIENSLGVIYLDKKDYRNAEMKFRNSLEIYKKLIKNEPYIHELSYAGTLTNLGITLSMKGEYQTAVKEYKKAIRIYEKLANKDFNEYGVDLSNAWMNLGVTYLNSKEFDKAEDALNNSLTILTKDKIESSNLARVYLNLGDLYSQQRPKQAISSYKKALYIFEKLADKNPNDYEIYLALTLYHLGLEYSSNGEYDKAFGLYNDALVLFKKHVNIDKIIYNPEMVYLLFEMQYINTKRNKVFKEKILLNDILNILNKLDSQNQKSLSIGYSHILNRIGFIFQEKEQYTIALEYFNKAIKAYPHAFYFNNRAYINCKLGKLNECKKDLEKSKKLNSSNSWLYRNWACFYSIKNDTKAAINALDLAVDNGFYNYKWVEQESLLKKVRNHPKYPKIIEKMKKRYNNKIQNKFIKLTLNP